MAKKVQDVFKALFEMTGGADEEVLSKYTEAERVAEEKEMAEYARKAEEKAALPALLYSLHYPHAFRHLRCSWCNEVFSTNYCSNSYCSDSCTREYLASIGIKYRNGKISKEHEEPLVVKPELLRQVYDWAKSFVQSYEYLDNINDHPKNNPNRAKLQRVIKLPSGKLAVEYLEVQDQEYGLPFIRQSQKSEDQKEQGLAGLSVYDEEGVSDSLPRHEHEPKEGNVEEEDFSSLLQEFDLPEDLF